MQKKASEAENASTTDTEMRLRRGVIVLSTEGSDGSEQTQLRIGPRLLRVDNEETRCILSLLKNKQTISQIHQEFPDFKEAEIDNAIDTLIKLGVVEFTVAGNEETRESAQVETTESTKRRAFLDIGIAGDTAHQLLNGSNVSIVSNGSNGLIADSVQNALQAMGINPSVLVDVFNSCENSKDLNHAPSKSIRILSQSDVVVVAPSAYNLIALENFNTLALKNEIPWISMLCSGFRFRVGPFILPKRTPCYTCYMRRLQGNNQLYHEDKVFFDAVKNGGIFVPPSDNLVTGVVTYAAHIIALDVVRHIISPISMNVKPMLYGAFADYTLTEGILHKFLKLPRCPACGVRAAGQPTTRTWMEPYEYRVA